MYKWRKMSDDERRKELTFRKDSAFPPHSPPHSKEEGWNRYHLTSAIFEHAPIIGKSRERMGMFAVELCHVLLAGNDTELYAWCVLPNHWHCTADRRVRSDRHFYAVRNYIHNNPVKHGYVEKWADWEFSSAVDYLDEVGKDEAARLWREFPVLDMGEKWDF